MVAPSDLRGGGEVLCTGLTGSACVSCGPNIQRRGYKKLFVLNANCCFPPLCLNREETANAGTKHVMENRPTLHRTSLNYDIIPRERRVPLQDVQGHVELRLVGGCRADQFALGVSRNDGAVCQRESVQRAESVAVPQNCENRQKETENYQNFERHPLI